MLMIFKKTSYDFVGNRWTAFYFSIALFVAGIAGFVYHGGPHLSIDFTGGKLYEFAFAQPIDMAKVRSVVEGAGLEHADVNGIGSDGRSIVVRAPVASVTGSTGFDKKIVDALTAAFPGNKVEIRRNDEVGGKVGRELLGQTYLAVLYASLGILIYVMVRFRSIGGFRAGIASIIALLHDAFITTGFLTVIGRETSVLVVAAVLTIVGYSIMDSIVVLDRIREKLRVLVKEPYDAVVNKAINETLSRTVITVLTVIMVLLSLLFLGGEVIRDFTITLLFGVVVGTYSSIFVVTPILVEWEHRSPRVVAVRR